MGDKLKASSAVFTGRVIGVPATGSPRTLVFLRDGTPVLAIPVQGSDFSFSTTFKEPGDYRLQLQRGSAIEALTNPINLEPPPRSVLAV